MWGVLIMPLQPGDVVGAYQIEEQLGTGGMATVYKANHAKLDRAVAIKVMHPQLMEDESFHVRFEREAKVVARLDHPNIIQVYDYSEYEKQPYLVMKYVDGRTLKGVLRDGALPLDEIRRMMHIIAGALDYAHKQGVLHRDVKPSNIIIAEDGTPFITDFGLARIAQAGESTMSADMMLGTPQYISPEQARGDKDIDFHTDLYSFAIVLYELLVGRVPFSADTAYATVHEQIYTPTPKPSVFNPEITPEVEAVLLKALSKNPQERYSSAKALMQALDAALQKSNLNALDPERASKAVPVQFTPSPIPPAVKETGRVITPPQIPTPFADAMDQAFMAAGQAINQAFDSGRDQRRNMRDMQKQIRKARRSGNWQRTTWTPGTEWVQDDPEGPGFYGRDELKELTDGMTDEQRVRKFVEKKMNERTGLLIHLAIFFSINLMLWIIWLMTSIDAHQFEFPWPAIVSLSWGAGMWAHYLSYYNRYGAGRDRREAMIEQELERERSRTGKIKNEDLFYDPASRIRLTEDGELSDSYIEEVEENKRKRNP